MRVLQYAYFLIAELSTANSCFHSQDVAYLIFYSLFYLAQSELSTMDSRINGTGPPHAWPLQVSRLADHTPIQEEDDDRPQLPREWSSRKKTAIVAIVSSLNFLV